MKMIIATLLFASLSLASAAETNDASTFHALQKITGGEHKIVYLPIQDSQLASVEGGFNVQHFLKLLPHQLRVKPIVKSIFKINRINSVKIINRRIVRQINVCEKRMCNSKVNINRAFFHQRIR